MLGLSLNLYNIRDVLEPDFLVVLGKDEYLSALVDPLAVPLVRFELLIAAKMSQACATPVKCVIAGDVGHEGGEGLDPCVMLIPVEQIYLLPILLLAYIDWLPRPTLIIEECDDVDSHLELIFDGRDV